MIADALTLLSGVVISNNGFDVLAKQVLVFQREHFN